MLIQDVLVVVEDRRLDVIERHRVDGVVDHAVLPNRVVDALLQLADVVIERHHALLVDVLQQRAAGPGHDHSRSVPGAHRSADLLLIGVVLNGLNVDLLITGFVEAIEVLGDGVPASAGEDPRLGLLIGPAAGGQCQQGGSCETCCAGLKDRSARHVAVLSSW